MMREAHISATVIQIPQPDNPNSYVMHDGQLNNGERGKLTLYWDTINSADESLAEAASRALSEKSGRVFSPADLTWKDYIMVSSEMPSQNLLLEAEIFLLSLPADFALASLKNSLLKTDRDIAKARIGGGITALASTALAKVVGI